MNNVFNLVFDKWDVDTPVPNAKTLYVGDDYRFGNPENLIKHYVDDTSRTDKFSWKICKMNEVIENPNQNYYYIINHILSIDKLFKEDMLPFSKEVIDFVKKYNNFFIIFLTEHECDNEDGFKILNEYIVNNDLNGSKFFVINNNAKLEDYKIKYNSQINTHSIQFIAHSSTKVLVKVGGFDFTPNKELLKKHLEELFLQL